MYPQEAGDYIRESARSRGDRTCVCVMEKLFIWERSLPGFSTPARLPEIMLRYNYGGSWKRTESSPHHVKQKCHTAVADRSLITDYTTGSYWLNRMMERPIEGTAKTSPWRSYPVIHSLGHRIHRKSITIK